MRTYLPQDEAPVTIWIELLQLIMQLLPHTLCHRNRQQFSGPEIRTADDAALLHSSKAYHSYTLEWLTAPTSLILELQGTCIFQGKSI